MKDVTELALGGIGIALSTVGWLAQGDATALTTLIPQYGSLGVIMALVWYHTTVSMPKMQSEYRAEREAMLALHKQEMDEKRADFLKALERTECRFMRQNQ